MRLLAFIVALVALGLSGCKGNCRQLSEKLCECTLNSLEKDACLRQASTNESAAVVSATDEQRCGELLKVCDCHVVDTAQGKKNCGLAR